MKKKSPPSKIQLEKILRVSLLGQSVSQALFKPIDIASLVYFRIVFYTIMVWEALRLIDHDWVERYFSGKDFYFTYWPFDFIHPWSGNGMTIHLPLMAVVATYAALGLFYRASATIFFFMITYIFLLEKALYLNHVYLVCLIAFLAIFIPAHYAFSFDILRQPKQHLSVVPAWSLWLLRFQVGIPYFFGGIAKINADWLQGEPLRMWLANHTDFPILGQFFTNEVVLWLMNYGALVFDLLVIFFLLNYRTRVFAYIVTLIFHFMNSRLFDIGIFPWTMIAVTAIFFEPEWPRRVLHDIRQKHPSRFPALVGGIVLGFFIGGFLPKEFSWMRAFIGAVGVAIAAYHLDEPFQSPEREKMTVEIQPAENASRDKQETSQRLISNSKLAAKKMTFFFLAIWVTFQSLIPIRHFFIPGNVSWTEEGHNFSWHMKLRNKEAKGFFIVTDPITGKEWRINPQKYLTPRQQRKMSTRPHMIVQFAHHLEKLMRDKGYENVEVRARIIASLNGRKYQRLIDPKVDLTTIPYIWWGHGNWILPLDVPLKKNK